MPNNLLLRGGGQNPHLNEKSTLDSSKNMYQSAFDSVEPFESYGLKLRSSVLMVGEGDIMHG